ncbi:MAG: PIN domain-containing protein [Acidobacteriota bacterium]|nr:PIN domain-containing protein [Acidobacteriota bacterium]
MGLILDTGVLIAAERRGQAVSDLLRSIREHTGQDQLAMSAISAMELAHGIWRADSDVRAKLRRLFLDEVYAAIPVLPFTRETAERAARIDVENRRRGKLIALAALQIGATALELGYSVATGNARHFEMIPDVNVIHL